MLIFSTKLIVNEKLTREEFVKLVTGWLSNNRHYKFGKFTYDGSKEYKLDKGTDCLEIADYPEALAVHMTSVSEGVIWTNDYVLTQMNGKAILAIQLYSDAADLSVRMPEKFNKPRLLRQVVQKGFGGMDGDISVSNEPFIIGENNIEVARKLIMRESAYFMPVIYVSHPRYAIDSPVDYNIMAQNLSGIAHVVVESKEIASKVRKLTDERNPYDSAVDIIYGQSSSYRVLPENFDSLEDMRRFVENTVQQKILMTRIDDSFSWMKIHFAHLQSDNQGDSELINLYKQFLKEAEDDGELKKKHIDSLELHIMEMEDKIKELNATLANKESQLQTYQYQFAQTGKSLSGADVGIISSERELYVSEVKDVVLRILEKERNTMDSDSNLKVSRKFHVLQDILKLNEQTGKAEEISECLRNIIDQSGKLNAQKKRQLIELGFEIKVGTHYKITFNEDERYSFTLSKTPGDYKSNLNTIKDAISALFGR